MVGDHLHHVARLETSEPAHIGIGSPPIILAIREDAPLHFAAERFSHFSFSVWRSSKRIIKDAPEALEGGAFGIVCIRCRLQDAL